MICICLISVLIFCSFAEKYKSMDVSDIVEDDEEAFLKGSGQVFSSRSQLIQRDISIFNDVGSELAKFGALQGAAQMSSQNEEQRKNSYLAAEPMSKDLPLNLSVGLQSPLCSKFYQLDQQDWEDGILWDNSPAISDNSVESCDTSGYDSGSSFIKETEKVIGLQNLHSKLAMELNEKHDNFLLQGSPLLESFDSGDSSGPGNIQFSESRCHPQLLRLESRLEVDQYNHADGRRENNAVELHQSDAVRCFRKLALQNRDLIEGSWLDDIIWEPHGANVKPKLILDLQDEQMLFEILDNRDSKHLRLHAGAMIMTRSLKPRVSPEQPGHGYQSGWQFNIANDRFYMNRKISQQLQSNSNKRTAYGIKVHHSAPAIKLQTMKLKLSK